MFGASECWLIWVSLSFSFSLSLSLPVSRIFLSCTVRYLPKNENFYYYSKSKYWSLIKNNLGIVRDIVPFVTHFCVVNSVTIPTVSLHSGEVCLLVNFPQQCWRCPSVCLCIFISSVSLFTCLPPNLWRSLSVCNFLSPLCLSVIKNVWPVVY